MNKLIRWYNQNRLVFWIGFIVVALAFIVIQILNTLVGEEDARKWNEIALNSNKAKTDYTISNSNTSVINGETISNGNSKTNEQIIKEFVSYCNDGEVEKAYNMLSEDCKKAVYPSLEQFNQNYYKRRFNGRRMYELRNWYANNNAYTYYINYTDDALATGIISSNASTSDYITVSKENENYRLNISSYIGREICDRKVSVDGIDLSLNYIDVYMDYSIANITAKNNTKTTICLDTKEKLDSTYMYDRNEVKYKSFLHEVAREQLIMSRGITSNINIKFNKVYNLDRIIEGIMFTDVVTNYEDYISNNSEKNTIIINIDV